MRQLFPLLLLVLAAGCGGGEGGHPVVGNVKFQDGSAVPRGTVTYDDGQQSFRGEIEEDGSYQLVGSGDSTEIPEGEYKVGVIAFEAGAEGDDQGHVAENAPPPKRLVHEKFGGPATSGITKTVGGDQADYDIVVEKP